MRLSAYKQAISETRGLPECVPEMKRYFNDNYSPKDQAIEHILSMARVDLKLFSSEFRELWEHVESFRGNEVTMTELKPEPNDAAIWREAIASVRLAQEFPGEQEEPRTDLKPDMDNAGKYTDEPTYCPPDGCTNEPDPITRANALFDDLLDTATPHLVRVLLHGQKHEGKNSSWENLPPEQHVAHALNHIRHMTRVKRYDQDSGELLLAHAIVRLLFALQRLEDTDNPALGGKVEE